MGRMSYEQVMNRYRGQVLPKSDPRNRMVERVLQRIVESNGLQGREKWGWEVRVIDDEEVVNAFVLPGYVGCDNSLLLKQASKGQS